MFFLASMNAQIDSRNKSISIPAIESPKDSLDSKSILPSKPIESNNTFKGFSTPKTSPQFNFPKKEFSMTGGEVFGNPGELYQKRFDKIEEDLKPEENGENSGLKENAFWGDYRTKSDYIDISYRDFGLVDGDYLRVLVDDDIIRSNELLIANFTGFRLKLKEGINKIEFYAINEGSVLPNTAEYRIIDQWSYLITGKIWALAAKVKVTIIIVKE